MHHPEDLLDARDIGIGFDGMPVLEHAHLRVRRGEIVSLIGPNGAGKTTLVRVILGLLRPDAGQVWLRPQTRVAYMPQRLQLDSVLPMTVGRFLRLGMLKGQARAEINDVLKRVSAGVALNAPLQNVSGGELQRVLLARCLLRRPQLMVLDEPAQGVDLSGQEALYQLIGQIRDEYDCGVLLISHNLHLVMAATDEVICLNRHVCCTGSPEAIARHPEFVALFGDAYQNLAVYTHHHDHHHDVHGNVVPENEVPGV